MRTLILQLLLFAMAASVDADPVDIRVNDSNGSEDLEQVGEAGESTGGAGTHGRAPQGY